MPQHLNGINPTSKNKRSNSNQIQYCIPRAFFHKKRRADKKNIYNGEENNDILINTYLSFWCQIQCPAECAADRNLNEG